MDPVSAIASGYGLYQLLCTICKGASLFANLKPEMNKLGEAIADLGMVYKAAKLAVEAAGGEMPQPAASSSSASTLKEDDTINLENPTLDSLLQLSHQQLGGVQAELENIEAEIKAGRIIAKIAKYAPLLQQLLAGVKQLVKREDINQLIKNAERAKLTLNVVTMLANLEASQKLEQDLRSYASNVKAELKKISTQSTELRKEQLRRDARQEESVAQIPKKTTDLLKRWLSSIAVRDGDDVGFSTSHTGRFKGKKKLGRHVMKSGLHNQQIDIDRLDDFLKTEDPTAEDMKMLFASTQSTNPPSNSTNNLSLCVKAAYTSSSAGSTLKSSTSPTEAGIGEHEIGDNRLLETFALTSESVERHSNRASPKFLIDDDHHQDTLGGAAPVSQLSNVLDQEPNHGWEHRRDLVLPTNRIYDGPFTAESEPNPKPPSAHTRVFFARYKEASEDDSIEERGGRYLSDDEGSDNETTSINEDEHGLVLPNRIVEAFCNRCAKLIPIFDDVLKCKSEVGVSPSGERVICAASELRFGGSAPHIWKPNDGDYLPCLGTSQHRQHWASVYGVFQEEVSRRIGLTYFCYDCYTVNFMLRASEEAAKDWTEIPIQEFEDIFSRPASKSTSLCLLACHDCADDIVRDKNSNNLPSLYRLENGFGYRCGYCLKPSMLVRDLDQPLQERIHGFEPQPTSCCVM